MNRLYRKECDAARAITARLATHTMTLDFRFGAGTLASGAEDGTDEAEKFSPAAAGVSGDGKYTGAGRDTSSCAIAAVSTETGIET